MERDRFEPLEVTGHPERYRKPLTGKEKALMLFVIAASVAVICLAIYGTALMVQGVTHMIRYH